MPKGKRTRKSKKPVPHSWMGLLLMFVVLVAATVGGAWLLLDYLNNRPLDLEAHSLEAASYVEEALAAVGIDSKALARGEEELVTDESGRWYHFDFDMTLPPGLTYQGLQDKLNEALEARGVKVSSSDNAGTLLVSLLGHEFARLRTKETQPVAAPTGGKSNPEAASPTPALEPLTPSELEAPPAQAEPAGENPAPYSPLAPAKPGPAPVAVANLTLPDLEGATASRESNGGRAAIIVDDGGYGGAATEKILALDPNLTLAIIPGTPQATETANKAKAAGFQVMLHMPMEAVGGDNGKLETLRVSMTPEEIEAVTYRAMADVPGVSGVNNHEGSAFTANAPAMTAFLNVLRANSLFFIDSLTSSRSVGGPTAKALGIPTAARDVFLDNESEATYIRGQFELLVEMVHTKGTAIGICHFRPDTAVALEELLPRLKEENIVLVHASELVK